MLTLEFREKLIRDTPNMRATIEGMGERREYQYFTLSPHLKPILKLVSSLQIDFPLGPELRFGTNL